MLIAVIADNSHIRVRFEGDGGVHFAAPIATEPQQTDFYYACMLEQLFALCGVEKERIEGVVLGSVVPQLTHALMGALSWVTCKRPLNVSSGVKTGLNIRSDQPQQVGADRVAAAVAAKARGKLPCVVVDCGAATTFTVLDQDGALVASAITAGVRMSLDALHAQSAQLPTVALDNGVKYDVLARNTADAMRVGAVVGAAAMIDGMVALDNGVKYDVLARNTADAMRVGAVVGAAAMIDGMVARYAEALGETPQVWLTGEGVQLVARHIRTCWDGADDLVFEGLRLIWEKNHPNR